MKGNTVLNGLQTEKNLKHGITEHKTGCTVMNAWMSVYRETGCRISCDTDCDIIMQIVPKRIKKL